MLRNTSNYGESVIKAIVKKTCTLREKCPYLQLFWSVFSIRMWENTDQNNSEYGHFLHSGN